jgi:hypothetical protein
MYQLGEATSWRTKMKTNIRLLVVTSLTLCAALLAMPGTAHSQIFAVSTDGTVGEYNFDGTTVNASLVSVPADRYGYSTVVSGTNIFIESHSNGTVGEYTTSGATVNASLVSGLPILLGGIAISGTKMFVVCSGNGIGDGSIYEYSTSGVPLWTPWLVGLDRPLSIAISGTSVFVEETGPYVVTVGEYDGSTTNGAIINAALFPDGLTGQIAVCGTNLFIYNNNSNGIPQVGEYTTSGATNNASLITLGEFQHIESFAVSGTNIFIASYDESDVTHSTIGEYTTSGATVNASLISGAAAGLSIAVVSETTTPPLSINSISVSGASLMMSATGGSAGGTYYLLESTNLAVTPFSAWSPVFTNTFDSNGNTTTNIANLVNQNVPAMFFILQTQ